MCNNCCQELEVLYAVEETDVFDDALSCGARQAEDGSASANRKALARVVAVESACGHIPSDDRVAVAGTFDDGRRHLRAAIDTIEPP